MTVTELRDRCLARLPAGGVALLERGVCLLLAIFVEIGVRTTPLPRLARTLGVTLSNGHAPLTPPSVLPRWVEPRLDAVARVLQRWPVPYEAACLRRALVTGQRLRKLDPELVIGVRRVDGRLQAHAWLSVCGGGLDPSAGSFSALSLPS